MTKAKRLSKLKRLTGGRIIWQVTDVRKLDTGHAVIVGANYPAIDEDILEFVQEKRPDLDNWFIHEQTGDEERKQWFWMVTR